MPETPKYAIPYPATTDRPSATQLQSLAGGVEGALDDAVEGVLADLAASDHAWEFLPPQLGWSAGTGPNAPKIKRVGTRVTYKGSLYGGTPGSTAALLPSWARPSTSVGTLRVPAAIGDTGMGFVRVYPVGAFQPSGNLNAEAMTSWEVA